MTEYEYSVLKRYVDDDELAEIVAANEVQTDAENEVGGVEDWLERLAKDDDWTSALVESINVQAVKDYRHYRWLQRVLYADHIKSVEDRKATIKRAEKELLKHAKAYHKKVEDAEKAYKKADKKYREATKNVRELREYFTGEPWGNIDGNWVMKQIDDQIEMDYERMADHE